MAREATARSAPPQSGFSGTLGVGIEKCTPALVEGRMTAGAGHTDTTGTRVHAGVLAGFAESLIAAGANAGLAPHQSAFTADSNAHYVAPAAPGALRGVARTLSSTPGAQVWQAEVFDANDALVALLTQTQRVAGIAPVPQKAAPVAAVITTPGPATRTAETIPEQRLKQIVSGASQAFGKTGYAATSMRDVAAAAGMPIATMYQYVTGKEKLLLLIFETYMAEITAALERANAPGKAPRQRLHDCIEATLGLYDAYRRQIRLMYQEGRSLSLENRERVRRLAGSTHRIWEGILRDGIATGEFRCRDASVTASFIPLLCSIWVVRYSSVKGTSLAKLRESILELVEGGLGAAPKRVKGARS